MNSKIWIVIEREYMTRVRRKSFIVMTLIGPLLMLLLMFAPALLMAYGGEDEQVIAVLDHTGLYGDVLKNTEDYQFVKADKSISDYRKDAKDAVVSGVLEIRQDLREDPKAMTLFSFKTLPKGIENYINGAFSSYVTSQKLRSYHVDSIEDIIRESETRLSVNTFRVGDNGEESISSGAISMGLGLLLAILIYTFIQLYGSSVLQSVMEEKKSRIMEIMVSSVRPFDLMMGKIIGVGAVGLTQICIWAILVTGFAQLGQMFFLPDMSSLGASSGVASVGVNELSSSSIFALLGSLNYVEVFICFVLYFIGGFLLYSSLFAALGSAVSSDEDVQSLMWPITVVLLLAFYAGMACLNSPDSTFAHVASYIPFSSPVVMMIRIPYGVSIWEEIISLIVLYGSFVALTYLSARIYRIGVLMYGKNPTLKEVLRWLRD